MLLQPPIEIEHLYISPAHNFFGHHGHAPGKHEMIEVPEVRCFAGRGLEGDRFLDYKARYNGQITFFAMETHTRLSEQLGTRTKAPSVYRRNVITSGVDLNSLIGQEFELQGIRFAGAEECRPCEWMDLAFAAGAHDALKGNGGLRARILTDGFLKKRA